MTSDSELRDNGQPSSPTVSAVASLVSEKTEEHRKLYDHRLHQELTIKKPTEPAAAAGGLGSHSQMKGRRMSQFNSTLSTGITFGDDSDDEYSNMQSHALKANEATKTVSARPSRVAHSMSHQQQLYSISHEKVTEDTTACGMIPTDNPRSRRGSRTQSGVGSLRRKMSRAQSDCSSQGGAVHFLSKTFSHRSQESAVLNTKRNRRLSVDSDDSNASRESQETEEDVCFPMQQPEHTRINGIDFDELEEFVAEAARSRLAYNTPTMVGNVGMDLDAKYATSPGTSSGTSVSVSSAALKYTPKSTTTQKNSSPEDMAPGISFGDNKVENDEYIPMGDISQQYDMNGIPDARPGNYALPDRFSLFRSDLGETNHSPDIPSLIKDGENFRDLFRDGTATWWLDCICPTDEEMRCIAKAFGIHPLTAEDIRMQEAREKVELFKSYYFVCFHTFENDPESEDFLEPINMYVVVFRDGLLTFHYSPVSHPSNVRRRVRQLRDYVDVNSDWICYALIDDITDSFAPVIQSIEYEADLIEDSVFHSRDADVAAMLQTIGEGRRKTMTLMRLLSGKADVIKMFAKRCQDEANGIGPALTSEINIANLQFQDNKTPFQRNAPPVNLPLPQAQQHFEYQQRSQPRADVALYLGDIQDHVVTMFQNLSSYEKIFSRSHSNYLAQLQVESFRCNNRVTEMLGKVTMVGTMLVPLNVITGLFGMNVHVPGQTDDAGGGFGWFFSIVAFLLFLAVTSCILSSWWISRANRTVTLNEAAEAGTRSILNFRRFRNNPKQNRQKMAANKSVISCPSKYGRYY